MEQLTQKEIKWIKRLYEFNNDEVKSKQLTKDAEAATTATKGMIGIGISAIIALIVITLFYLN